MRIRPIREAELPVLVDDLWYPFTEEMGDLDPYNELADDVRADAIEYRERHFQDEDVATFLAEREESADAAEYVIAGYAVVTAGESPPIFARGREATIEELYVRPNYRNQGIATRLIERTETWAAAENCEYIELGVNADNETAQDLYESQGYTVRRLKMDKPLPQSNH